MNILWNLRTINFNIIIIINRTPFGLSDASEAFQNMMEKILFGIEGVRISIDDVIIHAELTKRLQQVFERCRKFNLKLNKLKCEFGVRQISTLGHVVSASGIQFCLHWKTFPTYDFSRNVWLCCEVYSQLCKYCGASLKAYAKGTEMALGRGADRGIRSVEGITVSRSSLGVFPFRCSNFRSH